MPEVRDELVITRRAGLARVLPGERELLAAAREEQFSVARIRVVGGRLLEPIAAAQVVETLERAAHAQADALPPALERRVADPREVGAAELAQDAAARLPRVLLEARRRRQHVDDAAHRVAAPERELVPRTTSM